jgi:hypothetical protein
MANDRTYPLRLSEEEAALVDAVQQHQGLRSQADVWRQALRQYATTLGVTAAPKPNKLRTKPKA